MHLLRKLVVACVRLEDRDDLLFNRDSLLLENSALRLIENALRKGYVLSEFAAQRWRYAIRVCSPAELSKCFRCGAQRLLCDGD